MRAQHEEYNSAQEYAQAMIDDIIALEKTLPTNDQLPINLLTYWCEEIQIWAEQCWNSYLAGKRDDYKFSEDEFTAAYNKAGIRYTEEVVDGLVEDGYVQMGIREDGEIVYSATNKGKEYLNKRYDDE
jgi:hypothetical protein